MTGPHGTFRIERATNHFTVERNSDGTLTCYRDCIVVTADGVRRLYGILDDLVGEL